MDFYDYVKGEDDALLSVSFINDHYVVTILIDGEPCEYNLEYLELKDMLATLKMKGFDAYESFFLNGSFTSIDETEMIIDYTERRTRRRFSKYDEELEESKTWE